MNSDVPAEPAGSGASVVSQDAIAGDTAAADHRERAMAPSQSRPSEAPAELRAAPSAQPVAETPAPTSEAENFVPHAASASIDRPSAGGGRIGLLFGVLSLVVVIVLAGAALAYFKFAKPAQDTEAANVAPASAASSAGAMPIAPVPAASTAIAPAVSSPTTSAVASPAPAEQASVAAMPTVTRAPSAATSIAATPPVDHTLQLASELVHKGERAYAQGDYETAVRHARSALDVHAGYAPAERLLQRASATQKRVSEEQEQARREAAAQAERAKAAAAEQAARTPPAPTPDQIYNRRAHDECARGFFGKACRHKIRQEVCVGVSLTAPGTSVFRDLKD
jgi:hypothetical protein